MFCPERCSPLLLVAICPEGDASVTAKLGELTGLLFGITRNTHHGGTQQPVSDLVSAL